MSEKGLAVEAQENKAGKTDAEVVRPSDPFADVAVESQTRSMAKPKDDTAKPENVKLETGKPAAGQLKKDVDPAPVASAYGLTKAFDLLGKMTANDWAASSDTQKKMLDFNANNKGDLDKLPASMVDGMASKDVNELNKWLKDKGYDLKLNPMGKDGIGVVVSTEIEGKWAASDTKPIQSNGNEYAAFRMKNKEVYSVAGHKEPVIKLSDKDGIKVYVTPYKGDLNGLDAIEVASKLTPGKNPAVENPDGYSHIVMPNVDMNRSSSLDWMKGMSNSEGRRVDQAIAQAVVKMDKNGFSAKEGIAIATSRSIDMTPQKDYTMKDAFIMWVEKDGVAKPLYATKIEQKDWKTPKK